MNLSLPGDLPYVQMDLSLPGDLPYKEAYLSSAEVESFAFCNMEVFHIHLPLDLTVPWVVAPLYRTVLGLPTASPEEAYATYPPSLTPCSPKQTSFLPLSHSSSSENFLLGVPVEHLLDHHPVAHLALPLHRSVDLGTSGPSLVAVVDRHPDGETVGLPLGLLNWPLPAVALRETEPSQWLSELVLRVAPLDPPFVLYLHLW